MEDGMDHEGSGVCGGSVIVAAVENRAKEVGMAILDLSRLSLGLLQYIETSRSYVVTLSIMEQFNTVDHLVVVNSRTTEVAHGLNHYTRLYPQAAVDRKWFDDTQGSALLSALCGPPATAAGCSEPNQGAAQTATENGARNYLATSAAAALLQYVTAELGIAVAPGALALEQLSLQSHMRIDPSTAAALELVKSQRPLPGGNMRHTCKSRSLFQMLNRTRTACGARLLRASLLQPLNDAATIRARLDAVEELTQSSEMAFGAASWLKQSLPRDLDKMCLNLGAPPPASGKGALSRPQRLVKLMQALMSIAKLMNSLPALVQSLGPAAGELLCAARDTFAAPVFASLVERTYAVIDEEAHSANNTFMNHIQCCFAVKAEADKFLDLSREAFSDTTERIYELASHYKSELDLPDLQTSYHARRGFSFSIPNIQQGDTSGMGRRRQHRSPAVGSGFLRDLPEGFQLLERKPKQLICTTQELNALNLRLRQTSADCLRLAEQVVETLRAELVGHMHLLRRLIDSIALLDMLLSFAEVASTSSADGREFCKPQIYNSAEAPLVIVGGRHALLEVQLAEEDKGPHQHQHFQQSGPSATTVQEESTHSTNEEKGFGSSPSGCRPNDAYLSKTSNFGLITGPNMSGKSTYLRQVGLAVVMAQAGCFVPASFASLSPFAQLHARAVHCDNLGGAAAESRETSSFMVEMIETAQIMKTTGHRSLVLMDELGRATSSVDGVAVSLAVAEQLAASPAFTLFTTHFPALTELVKVAPSSKLWHFEVSVDSNSLEFTWKICPGAHEVKQYGIRLAEWSGFPANVTALAKDISALFDEQAGGSGSDGGGADSGRLIHPGGSFVRYHLPAQGKADASAGIAPSSALLQQSNTGMSWADNMICLRKLLDISHRVTCLALASDGSGTHGAASGDAETEDIFSASSLAEIRLNLRPLKAAAQELVMMLSGSPCPGLNPLSTNVTDMNIPLGPALSSSAPAGLRSIPQA